ncbi:site-specific recombinase XerD [Pseudoduganella lurida]|uniref:Site-specific recombinase XerD n=1 Tax=Pseudoduganella lurida TaxID=1036180 RepID=A0A562RLI4_9BURK|nr:tyrosine-type recombinase/integrase [Pseudoduganella lurida]TWI69316.1 site-specific recombinase XerD [Pseudoduganella lurida]
MTISAWDREPVAAFEQFLYSSGFAQTAKRAAPPVSAASAEVYKFMFGRFAKWLRVRGRTFSQLAPGDLIEFLGSRDARGRPLQSKIAYRYLRLLERCYEHLDMVPNPASAAITILGSNRPARDREMVALSPAQAGQVIAARPELTSWKRQRDRAMQLVMLCAGLRVAEAIGLLASEVATVPEQDGTLRIRLTPSGKQPTSRLHETFLQQAAVPEVLEWSAARQQLGIPGELLFPADDEGRPLHKSTVYRQARSALKEADVAMSHAGGRTLRNGFAVAELRAGTPEETMRKRLGLVRAPALDSYLSAARRLRDGKA